MTDGAHTQVFIVRIWREAEAAGECAIRIETRLILTGETHYFLEWRALTAYLAGKLEVAGPTPGERTERTTVGSCR